MRGGDYECGCIQPYGDPHACAVLSADEDIAEVVEDAELCDCDCHWPEVS